MKTLPALIALLALGAVAFDAQAQSASTPPASTPTTTDDVGHTGTDTAVTPAPVTDDVGHTGTDTAVTPTPVTDDVGHTGTDTMTTPAGPSPWTLSAKPGTISSPGSTTITVTMPAGGEGGGSYAVPLSSSTPDCTVPESVDLTWSSAGGTASFKVDCAKVASKQQVTITGGTTSTSFIVKP